MSWRQLFQIQTRFNKYKYHFCNRNAEIISIGSLLQFNFVQRKMERVQLINGCEMPTVGLGTWRASPQETELAVEAALNSGYRHIDTAFNYNTEEPIGKVIKKWLESGKGTREELFITTKLPNFGNRPSDVHKYLSMSLDKLGVEYVDLYLIHMPFSFHCSTTSFSPSVLEDGSFSLDTEHDITETWKEMEKQVEQGLTKAIGLSNYNEEQVQRIYDFAKIKPSVLQVELHAYLQQNDLRELCKRLNIIVTAYSPLGSPGANTHFSTKYHYSIHDFPDILGHPIVKEIAVKHNKLPGQILLRHLVQSGLIVIPKSGNPDRIQANINIFDFSLSSDDMTKLNSLDRHEAGRIFDFKFFKGVEKHPEYPFKVRTE